MANRNTGLRIKALLVGVAAVLLGAVPSYSGSASAQWRGIPALDGSAIAQSAIHNRNRNNNMQRQKGVIRNKSDGRNISDETVSNPYVLKITYGNYYNKTIDRTNGNLKSPTIYVNKGHHNKTAVVEDTVVNPVLNFANQQRATTGNTKQRDSRSVFLRTYDNSGTDVHTDINADIAKNNNPYVTNVRYHPTMASNMRPVSSVTEKYDNSAGQTFQGVRHFPTLTTVKSNNLSVSSNNVDKSKVNSKDVTHLPTKIMDAFTKKDKVNDIFMQTDTKSVGAENLNESLAEQSQTILLISDSSLDSIISNKTKTANNEESKKMLPFLIELQDGQQRYNEDDLGVLIDKTQEQSIGGTSTISLMHGRHPRIITETIGTKPILFTRTKSKPASADSQQLHNQSNTLYAINKSKVPQVFNPSQGFIINRLRQGLLDSKTRTVLPDNGSNSQPPVSAIPNSSPTPNNNQGIAASTNTYAASVHASQAVRSPPNYLIYKLVPATAFVSNTGGTDATTQQDVLNPWLYKFPPWFEPHNPPPPGVTLEHLHEIDGDLHLDLADLRHKVPGDQLINVRVPSFSQHKEEVVRTILDSSVGHLSKENYGKDVIGGSDVPAASGLNNIYRGENINNDEILLISDDTFSSQEVENTVGPLILGDNKGTILLPPADISFHGNSDVDGANVASKIRNAINFGNRVHPDYGDEFPLHVLTNSASHSGFADIIDGTVVLDNVNADVQLNAFLNEPHHPVTTHSIVTDTGSHSNVNNFGTIGTNNYIRKPKVLTNYIINNSDYTHDGSKYGTGLAGDDISIHPDKLSEISGYGMKDNVGDIDDGIIITHHGTGYQVGRDEPISDSLADIAHISNHDTDIDVHVNLAGNDHSNFHSIAEDATNPNYGNEFYPAGGIGLDAQIHDHRISDADISIDHPVHNDYSDYNGNAKYNNAVPDYSFPIHSNNDKNIGIDYTYHDNSENENEHSGHGPTHQHENNGNSDLNFHHQNYKPHNSDYEYDTEGNKNQYSNYESDNGHSNGDFAGYGAKDLEADLGNKEHETLHYHPHGVANQYESNNGKEHHFTPDKYETNNNDYNANHPDYYEHGGDKYTPGGDIHTPSSEYHAQHYAPEDSQYTHNGEFDEQDTGHPVDYDDKYLLANPARYPETHLHETTGHGNGYIRFQNDHDYRDDSSNDCDDNSDHYDGQNIPIKHTEYTEDNDEKGHDYGPSNYENNNINYNGYYKPTPTPFHPSLKPFTPSLRDPTVIPYSNRLLFNSPTDYILPDRYRTGKYIYHPRLNYQKNHNSDGFTSKPGVLRSVYESPTKLRYPNYHGGSNYQKEFTPSPLLYIGNSPYEIAHTSQISIGQPITYWVPNSHHLAVIRTNYPSEDSFGSSSNTNHVAVGLHPSVQTVKSQDFFDTLPRGNKKNVSILPSSISIGIQPNNYAYRGLNYTSKSNKKERKDSSPININGTNFTKAPTTLQRKDLGQVMNLNFEISLRDNPPHIKRQRKSGNLHISAANISKNINRKHMHMPQTRLRSLPKYDQPPPVTITSNQQILGHIMSSSGSNVTPSSVLAKSSQNSAVRQNLRRKIKKIRRRETDDVKGRDWRWPSE